MNKSEGVKNIELKLRSLALDYKREYLPIKGTKVRADFYIPSMNLLIEYEGIVSNKSRHTSILGYSKDCEKYNLYSLSGYKLLRYTVITLHNLIEDLKKLATDKVERR